jgi:hypothetical protein
VLRRLVGSGIARGAELVDGYPAAAAGTLAPVTRRLGQANKRAQELQGVLVECGAARVCEEKQAEMEFTVRAPMADGGGLVLARGEDRPALYLSSRRLRRWLGHQVEASPGMGRSMAGVRRTGRRRACGHRPMPARGRRGVAGVQAARGTVRGTHTRRVQGLGHGVRPNGRRPASTFVYGGLAACRRGRAWPYA